MIGDALHAARDSGAERAAWIDEDLAPLEPRNIYGVTKLAAEHLCRMTSQERGLPVVVLRTGRFFPEADDMAHAIPHSDANTKANEFLFRRLTVEDAAEAHVAALEQAPAIGFDRFIVAAPTPFRPEDCGQLIVDAPAVVARYFPEYPGLYRRRGWTMFPSIDRVYSARHAPKPGSASAAAPASRKCWPPSRTAGSIRPGTLPGRHPHDDQVAQRAVLAARGAVQHLLLAKAETAVGAARPLVVVEHVELQPRRPELVEDVADQLPQGRRSPPLPRPVDRDPYQLDRAPGPAYPRQDRKTTAIGRQVLDDQVALLGIDEAGRVAVRGPRAQEACIVGALLEDREPEEVFRTGEAQTDCARRSPAGIAQQRGHRHV